MLTSKSTLVLAMAIICSVAQAQTKRSEDLPPRPVVSKNAETGSGPDRERQRYNFSGTVGRLGLGADPTRPEGPGNISN
ncbi:hypothetical protein [Methylosinus sp. PW1]|uniref:hypothetical protein n=1 Tax=Methylosinus sp. PW1 TaxID=107636 RepID=UPI00055F4C5D|nr:hypothetical protein [Methylosinus sp. PW1]